MVALLWDDGLVNAAVQLEAMWEELRRRHPFSLFCGYRADSVTSDIDAFAEMCRLHGEILHGEIVGSRCGTTRTFAFSREAPAAARHFAVATLNAWGAGNLADDAALVVTELAANAIVHAAFRLHRHPVRAATTCCASRSATRARWAARRCGPPRCTACGRWTRWPAGGE